VDKQIHTIIVHGSSLFDVSPTFLAFDVCSIESSWSIIFRASSRRALH
jgi:hypothetical protein